MKIVSPNEMRSLEEKAFASGTSEFELMEHTKTSRRMNNC